VNADDLPTIVQGTIVIISVDIIVIQAFYLFHPCFSKKKTLYSKEFKDQDLKILLSEQFPEKSTTVIDGT